MRWELLLLLFNADVITDSLLLQQSFFKTELDCLRDRYTFSPTDAYWLFETVRYIPTFHLYCKESFVLCSFDAIDMKTINNYPSFHTLQIFSILYFQPTFHGLIYHLTRLRSTPTLCRFFVLGRWVLLYCHCFSRFFSFLHLKQIRHHTEVKEKWLVLI